MTRIYLPVCPPVNDRVTFHLGIHMGTEKPLPVSAIMKEREHKAIIQVSRVAAGEQGVIIGQINNLRRSLPNARVKVVFHSQGIPLVVAKQSEAAAQVEAGGNPGCL